MKKRTTKLITRIDSLRSWVKGVQGSLKRMDEELRALRKAVRKG